MLQMNSATNDEICIIQLVSNLFFVDSVLNQYLLMLGEFHTDGLQYHANAALCFTIFIAMTFVSQVIFLNILAGIMGDAFDRMIEQRPKYLLKKKLMLIALMKGVIQ